MRLAIIGAGVGGCSAAFYANRLIPSCDITVYESSARIGGRVYGVNLDNQRVEIGAAFFKKSNQFLTELLKEFKIKSNPIHNPTSIGIWNGKTFIIKTKHPTLAAILIFLRRPINIVRLLSTLRELDRRNQIVYREARNHPSEWDELFTTARIMEWLQRSLRDVLIEKGIDSNFIDNILEPITRVIYNQDSSLNAYAGLSAIKIIRGKTFNIDSGNELLPKRLLEESGAALELGLEVENIDSREDGSYEVSGRDFSDTFDSVIIANQDTCNLKIETSLPMDCSSRIFQEVYVKIVRGNLNNSYFNIPPDGSLPDTIVSTREVPFTHIIKLKSEGILPIYSIASITPVNNLDDIFRDSEIMFQHKWSKAYPIFEPIQKMSKCRLDKFLYYPNCIESAVSAMEPSIMSAFNSVYLLRKELDASYFNGKVLK